MFHYAFMQRAFWAGGLIALLASVMGVYLLLRRQVLMADTLSHISLAGVAVGAIAGVEPVAGACLVAVAGAMGMEKLRRHFRSYSEVSVAIVMNAGLATALVLISLHQGLDKGFHAYLFGSIVAVRQQEVGWIAAIVALAACFFFTLRRPLYAITFDEESAKASGIPVRSISAAFSVLTGLTVSVAMPIVGVLLVSALMVLPAALAVRLAGSFAAALWIASGVGLGGMFAGLTVSYYAGTPPGGTITLLLVGCLGVGLGAEKLKRRRRSSRMTHWREEAG